MGKLPLIQNSETRKEKNDEFIFIKTKKTFVWPKKKKDKHSKRQS